MPHSGANSVITWSPGLHERHAVADALDDAGAFVPEHARRVAGRVGARGGVEVGVADAAGRQPNEHLAGLRLGELDLLHDQGPTELLQDGGANPHVRIFPHRGRLRAARRMPRC